MASTEVAQGETTSAKKVTFVTILRNGNFRNLWIGQVVSQIGDYFVGLALMVVVSSFSDDPAVVTANVAVIMIALTLPRLLFGILAGVFVDRWDRRLTMIASDLLRMVLTLGLIPAFLMHSLPLMFVLVFAASTVGAFFNPAKGALIPTLVPTEQLTSANSLSQTSMMLATFIGPALAGATFTIAGNGNEWVAFVVDSLSFLISAISIWFISVPTADESSPSAHREFAFGSSTEQLETGNSKSAIAQVWSEVVVGLKALFFNKAMATLAIVFAVTMLGVGALNVLWVAFFKTGFGFTQSDLAWRLSVVDIAFSAGMVIASVVVGNFFSNTAPKWLIVIGLIVGGGFFVPLGYLSNYWLVVAAMFGLGLFVAPINTGTATLMQLVVPNNQLGRVGGGIGTISDTATLASMSMAGALGAVLGIPLVFALGGILCILGGVLAWAALPPVSVKDKVEDGEATANVYTSIQETSNVA